MRYNNQKVELDDIVNKCDLRLIDDHEEIFKRIPEEYKNPCPEMTNTSFAQFKSMWSNLGNTQVMTPLELFRYLWTRDPTLDWADCKFHGYLLGTTEPVPHNIALKILFNLHFYKDGDDLNSEYYRIRRTFDRKKEEELEAQDNPEELVRQLCQHFVNTIVSENKHTVVFALPPADKDKTTYALGEYQTIFENLRHSGKKYNSNVIILAGFYESFTETDPFREHASRLPLQFALPKPGAGTKNDHVMYAQRQLEDGRLIRAENDRFIANLTQSHFERDDLRPRGFGVWLKEYNDKIVLWKRAIVFAFAVRRVLLRLYFTQCARQVDVLDRAQRLHLENSEWWKKLEDAKDTRYNSMKEAKELAKRASEAYTNELKTLEEAAAPKSRSDCAEHKPDKGYCSESSNELTCPKQHRLKPFTYGNNTLCDICRVDYAPGTQMYGCRHCDYDVCDTCWAIGEPFDSETKPGNEIRRRLAQAVSSVLLISGLLLIVGLIILAVRLYRSRETTRAKPTGADIV